METRMKPYYRDELITFYKGDCLEVMKDFNNKSFDLVVADPPYNFTTASAGSGKLNPWADLCNSAYWFSAWMKEAMRLLRDNGALWCFCNWRSIPTITKAVFDIGFQIESLLVWDKCWIGPGGLRGLRPSYELVALICKEGFQIADRSIYDIQKFKWSSTKPNGHPAEKPKDLVGWLINISNAKEILDPFLGSGTTAIASRDLNVKCVGIEISENYCQLVMNRLNQKTLNFAG